MKTSVRSGSVPVSNKALFVLFVFLANIILSGLVSTRAYAETLEIETDAVISTAEDTDTELIEGSENVETNQEETESDSESKETTDTSDEAVEEETNGQSDTTPQQQLELVVETSDTEEITENEEPVSLVADYSADCVIQLGIDLFDLRVTIDANQSLELEPGTDFSVKPSRLEPLFPTTLSDEEQSYVVSGWDGSDIDWTIGEATVGITLSEIPFCSDQTLLEQIQSQHPGEFTYLESLVNDPPRDKVCAIFLGYLNGGSVFGSAIDEDDQTEINRSTLFLPTDAALEALVASPATSENELNQLVGNPDELCLLLLHHVVNGGFTSADLLADAPQTLLNGFGGLMTSTDGSNLFVGGSKVSRTDIFGGANILHIIDAAIKPISVGLVTPLATDMVSPEINGTIAPEVQNFVDGRAVCTLVRINGIPYFANVSEDLLSWTIPAGVVQLNPTQSQTLFSTVVRIGSSEDCTSNEYQDEPVIRASNVAETVTHGGFLVGLTMQNNVLSFAEPEEEIEEEPADQGVILGISTDTPVVSLEAGGEVLGTQSCGKGSCDGQIVAQSGAAEESSELDTDGDGVPDSEDLDPNDPEVGRAEDANQEDGNSSEGSSSTSQNVFRWFLAGGGVAVIWYLLWQRTGRE